MAMYQQKTRDGTIYRLVTGRVSRDAELRTNNKGSLYRFSMNYDKGQFMDVDAWMDNEVGIMAGRLEKGDFVLVSGRYSEREYNGKTYSQITADFITPMVGSFTAAPAAQPEAANAAAPGITAADFDEVDDDGTLPF